jgi:hypothetical protein
MKLSDLENDKRRRLEHLSTSFHRGKMEGAHWKAHQEEHRSGEHKRSLRCTGQTKIERVYMGNDGVLGFELDAFLLSCFLGSLFLKVITKCG